MTGSLVRSKLARPTERPNTVERPELVSRLCGGPPGAIRAIVAPTGWGKSNLIGQWLDRWHGPVAFLSLDRFDNDQSRFWAHLLAAIAEALEIDLDDLAEPLRVATVSLTAEVVDPLLNRIGENEVLVVLDDLHTIRDTAVLESFQAFVDGCPPSVSFGFGSRTEPSLGLERRRVHGELIEIRLDDLRLDEGDGAAVVEQAAERAVDPAIVAELVARTEGWPAGLYLAGLSLRTADSDLLFVGRFAGSSRQISDYLSAEVLANLSSQDREFLMGTAVLGELDSQLCDAVRGADDSRRRLGELSRRNLFMIPTSEVEGRYRYHHLFQEWLVAELSGSGLTAVVEQHRKAAKIYAERGDAIRAMDHAMSAEDWTLANDLFQEHALRVIADGNHTTVAGWCARFPTSDGEVWASTVHISLAWLGIFEGDFDDSERHCRRLETLVPKGGPVTDWSGDPGQRAVIQGFCHHFRGALHDALEACAQARLDEIPVRTYAALRFIESATDYWLGQGDDGAFLEVAARAEEYGDQYAALLAHAYLAHLHLDRLDLTGARTWTTRIFDTASAQGLSTFWYGALAHLARARVALADGDFPAAAVDANRAIDLADSRNDVPASCLARLVAAEVCHSSDDRSAAHRHVGYVGDLIEPLDDPGILRERLHLVERQLRLPPGRGVRMFSDLPVEDLSDREMTLLRLLPGDLNQRELARVMTVSFNTIKTHNRSIYRKLGVTSRDDAVATARALGLL